MATATTAPTGILSNIDLKNFDLNDLTKIAKLIGKRTALGSVFVPTTMGDATLDNYTPEELAAMINVPGVTTGDTLDPTEVDRKREEREKALEEAKRNRAAGRYSEEVKKAAERGEYGDVSKMINTPAGPVYAPSAEEIERLRKEMEEYLKGTGTRLPSPEKFTGNVTTIPNIDDLISKPIGDGFTPEKTFTDLIYTPIPEIEPFTILTMADKNTDSVKIGKKIYSKDQTELKYRPDKIIDGVKVKGKGYRVVKEEFKDEAEKKRIADGKFVREELPKYFKVNSKVYDNLYEPNRSGTEELEKVQKYFKKFYDIDFDTKTYEKIISKQFGDRKEKNVRKSVNTTTKAHNEFKKTLREKLKAEGKTLSKPEIDRYLQDFRVALALEYGDKARGEEYPPEAIEGLTNLIIDTIMSNEDPYLPDYIADKIQRTANTKANLSKADGTTDKRKKYATQGETLGHTGSIAQGDVLFGEAANPERYTTESPKDNRDKEVFMNDYKKALEKNDTKEMTRIENKLKKRNLRAMYVDKDGFEVYIGASAEKGKLKDGGMVGISHLIRPL